MNNQQIENKVCKDAAKVKKDVGILVEDSATRFSRYEDSISQATDKAKEELTSKLEDGISQLSGGFEKMTNDAKETVIGVATAAKKGVGDGLSQYNAKAQEFADKAPGGLGQKAAKYPWVTIVIGLAVGLLLGGLLKPSRKS